MFPVTLRLASVPTLVATIPVNAEPFPTKKLPVTLPVADIKPAVNKLPDVLLPLTLRLVNTPTEVMLACAFAVTVPAVVADPAVVAYVALATGPVTLPPEIVVNKLPLPTK